MEYGLIGGKLGHSYSKTIHELLCGYSYELCPRLFAAAAVQGHQCDHPL